LPINYCSRFLELNSAAAAADYSVPAGFEIRGKSRGTSAKYKFCKAPIIVLLIWADVLAAQERILHRISTGS
jgi:hypothetical protein